MAVKAGRQGLIGLNGASSHRFRLFLIICILGIDMRGIGPNCVIVMAIPDVFRSLAIRRGRL
jgi:hypothetical protein